MGILWFYIFTVVACVISAVIFFYNQCFAYWKKRGVPILKPIIPFGDTIKVPLLQSGLGELLAEWYLSFKNRNVIHGGTYFFGKPMYVPVDPRIINRILITDFDHFTDHPFYIDQSGNDPISTHLFNVKGDQWRTLRSKLPSTFTGHKIRQMFLLMRTLTDALISRIDREVEQNQTVDACTIFSCFTIDNISACLLGLQTKTLQDQNKELVKHRDLFFSAQFSRLRSFLVFLIPHDILRMLKFRSFPKSTTKFFHNLFSNVVKQRSEEEARRNDLTDLLIRLTDKDDELLKSKFDGQGPMDPLSFDLFLGQMVVFLSAGSETSSTTISFALLELAQNIEYQERLRREINDVLGKYKGEMTIDALMEMEFLDQVINETLRKYPSLPAILRECVKDCYIPEGDVTIEKGTTIIISNLGLGRDAEYFPEPDKFNPGNFSKENAQNRPSVAYLPFGAGPRICLGKRFGLIQAKLGLATTIKNYNVKLDAKTKRPFKFSTEGIALKLAGGIWLNLEKL